MVYEGRLYPVSPYPLNQGFGYGIVIGFGVFFSVAITVLSWVQQKFGGVSTSSEGNLISITFSSFLVCLIGIIFYGFEVAVRVLEQLAINASLPPFHPLCCFLVLLWFFFSLYLETEFSTANRSVKIGLLASSVVSAWTWAATLLQSSSVAYSYGVSGPYW